MNDPDDVIMEDGSSESHEEETVKVEVFKKFYIRNLGFFQT